MPYIGAGIQRFNTADSLTVNGDAEVTGTVNPSGDTASGDTAAVGFTSTEGLILTGQGSTSDVVIKNDADTTVCFVPTGTDDLKFNDNATLIFGTGSDLTINHDGNNSFITDSGDGALYIQGTSGVFIRSADGGENLASFTDDGSVALNHDNTTRIETTSSGVDVTGIAVTDGLTSSAALDVTTSTHANASVFKSTGNTQLFLQDTDASSNDQFWGLQVSGGDFNILTCNDDRSGGFVTPLTIAQAGNTTLTCTAGDSNQALQAYHPTGTSARTIAKFQSNVGSTQADKVTIGCDGKVTIADGDLVIGTSGHGIDFSATGDASGATSELLDDYEEGTWTPVLTTSSGTAATYGAQQIGKYVKIGDLVHIYFDIAINQVNNSNTTLVSGHPFNSVNNDALAVSFFSTLAVSPVFVQFQSVGSSGFMAVGLTSAGTNITNGMGIFGNSTRIIASGTYRTA